MTVGDTSSNNLGLFLQDSWTIGEKLTLNLGLRTEHEKVPNYNPEDPASHRRTASGDTRSSTSASATRSLRASASPTT